ncbi:hypothetical protein [Streptomyces luteogriseus]|uniref:hypothetical protein n=1 Tax=Streptomyces luteogriseus TaxID=68233 RepID=UPI00380DC0A0
MTFLDDDPDGKSGMTVGCGVWSSQLGTDRLARAVLRCFTVPVSGGQPSEGLMGLVCGTGSSAVLFSQE